MVWHILTIITGVAVILAYRCPSPCSDITLGALVALFSSLALISFKKAKRNK